jgi:hypothetical protein
MRLNPFRPVGRVRKFFIVILSESITIFQITSIVHR